MSGHGWCALPAGLVALTLLACSRDTGRQGQPPAEASTPPSHRVPACSLLTSAEVAQAVGHAVGNVVAQDTLFAAGYWSSSCVFSFGTAPGHPAVLTVGVSGDYPSVADGDELADAVSAEAMGISAVPLAGLRYPAALYPDTGVVVQKGAARLVVSGPPRPVLTSLASTALARLQ